MIRTVLIGDVHGCLDELDALLKAVGAVDRVVFVGDLVAKGPDSQGVVQRARELGALTVRGNHDEHLLRWRRGEAKKPLKPVHQAVADALGEDDWRYLAATPLHLSLREHGVLVVHGGLLPGVPLATQRPEDLMNLRSITAKGEGSKRVDDGAPWASVWPGPQRVVFGHDAIRGLQQERFATGLDSGCVYGRELTALVLPEDRLVSVKAKRVYAEMKAAD